MLLCLDVGNTHILGGVFDGSQIVARFRYSTQMIGTADQFGIFLINILAINKIKPEQIQATAVSSVVPSYDYTLRHTISLYLPSHYYSIQAGVKTGLNIKVKNPNEVGADRIAAAIGAVNTYPNKDLIIIDMGTATTVDVITKNRDYIGGAIMSGMRLAMESLRSSTAKLMEVDIEAPTTVVGRTTRENIQIGLYYTQLGGLKEIIKDIKADKFKDEQVLVIGTGGFSQLFKDKGIFDVLMPDLVLQGLLKAYEYSQQT